MSAEPARTETPDASAPAARPQNKRLQQTQAQVDEVVDIMRVNMEKVLERDAKLSQLDDRADALQAGASQFEASAGKLKNKYWWKNMKNGITGVIVVIVVLLVIMFIMTGYIFGGKKTEQAAAPPATLLPPHGEGAPATHAAPPPHEPVSNRRRRWVASAPHPKIRLGI